MPGALAGHVSGGERIRWLLRVEHHDIITAAYACSVYELYSSLVNSHATYTYDMVLSSLVRAPSLLP